MLYSSFLWILHRGWTSNHSLSNFFCCETVRDLACRDSDSLTEPFEWLHSASLWSEHSCQLMGQYLYICQELHCLPQSIFSTSTCKLCPWQTLLRKDVGTEWDEGNSRSFHLLAHLFLLWKKERVEAKAHWVATIFPRLRFLGCWLLYLAFIAFQIDGNHLLV